MRKLGFLAALLTGLLWAVPAFAAACASGDGGCYVRSAAAGTNDGSSWTNAYTGLAAATLAHTDPGQVFYVSDDHTETAAAGGNVLITFPATSPAAKAFCVNHLGSVPPVTADLCATPTALVNSGTGTGNMWIKGYAYVYGITFQSGLGASTQTLNILATSGADGYIYMQNCKLNGMAGSGTNLAIQIGIGGVGNRQKVVLDNTPMKFAAAISGVTLSAADFIWKNTANAIDVSAATPTTLFQSNSLNQYPGRTYIYGVDFANLSGKTIFAAPSVYRQSYIIDSKLPASITVQATPVGGLSGGETVLVRSSSAAGTYYLNKWNYSGTLSPETTIVRSGGATNGTTAIAWNMTTTANATVTQPFESMPMTVWATAGAHTITVYGITGAAFTPTINDIWIEADYPVDAGDGLGGIVNTRTDFLGSTTPGNVTTDTSTWGGGNTKFKIAQTFTLAQAGFINVRVSAAKASSTFYIDPIPYVTGGSAVSRSAVQTPEVFTNDLGSINTGGAGGIIGG